MGASPSLHEAVKSYVEKRREELKDVLTGRRALELVPYLELPSYGIKKGDLELVDCGITISLSGKHVYLLFLYKGSEEENEIVEKIRNATGAKIVDTIIRPDCSESVIEVGGKSIKIKRMIKGEYKGKTIIEVERELLDYVSSLFPGDVEVSGTRE